MLQIQQHLIQEKIKIIDVARKYYDSLNFVRALGEKDKIKRKFISI